jgi:hypothetical protein
VGWGLIPEVSPIELQRFYEDLVRQLRDRGVVCAITSGLACVHYGIAETTKDCDLLCHPGSFGELLEVLKATQVQGVPCRYRGNLSPPLAARWHRGGWTSHFEWAAGLDPVTLDLFGYALRQSSPWQEELVGLYAGPQTVAEMKRTMRDKDWAFITALGLRMIEAGDDRGWLHIYDSETLTDLLRARTCPSELVEERPALRLAVEQDPRSAGALSAERKLWEELDRRRVRLLERHLRPYVSAVRKEVAGRALLLEEDHAVRIDCATRHLPDNPLKEYGLDKYLDETKAGLVASGLIPESALTWLPEVRSCFGWLDQ